MMSVLKVINNPLDDIALLSAMMCPIFGFTANETAEIRAKTENAICTRRCGFRPSREIKGSGLSRTCFPPQKIFRHPHRRPPYSKIYDDTGLPEIYLTEEGGSLKRQNLLRLRDISLDRVNEGYDTNFEFLRFAEKVQKGEIKLSADPSDGEGGGVRIMSIHHSKGLQFPVVFLAGLTKRKIPTHRPFSLIENTVWVLKSMTRAPEKILHPYVRGRKIGKSQKRKLGAFENLLCCGHPRHRQSFYNCLRKERGKRP